MIIDAAFEDKVLGCLIKSTQFCQAASRSLKPSYFDNPVKHNLGKMAIEFWADYNTKLSLTGFTAGMKRLITGKTLTEKDIPIYAAEWKRLNGIDVADFKFILDELITFIKNKETKKFIEDCVTKHLPKNNFEAIEKAMREIQAITADTEVEAYDYLDTANIDSRTKAREMDAECHFTGISTGIKRMDDLFPKKGWYRKELYTILAPPKRGKTMALQWFANAAMLQGFNAAIFTLETSREVYCDRMDAMNAGVEIKKLPGYIKEVATRLHGTRAEGRMFVFEYPTKRLTTDEIERQVKRLELERGISIDIIFVDYADIMKPNRHYENDLREQASIYEDLRAVAVIFDVPMVTAAQVNRMGSDKSIIKGKDTAGTWDKIMVSDAIISLSATDAELKKGEMKLHFAECRNIESATLKIKTAYNFGRFYKEFLEEVFESE